MVARKPDLGSYSQEDIELIRSKYELLSEKYSRLMSAYHDHQCIHPLAVEYARHGFMRRIGTLLRCIENTFVAIPLDHIDVPSRGRLLDATINIQAFVFNVFGAIDNLAWIWVTEAALTKKDGALLPNSWVGFGPSNKCVRNSLPVEFRKHLVLMDDWFRYLEDFRHALAHRIPLYIPPGAVSPAKEQEWHSLENEILAAARARDVMREDRLRREQDGLRRFLPWIMHSYSEKSRPIVFHGQLIADFLTVEELAWKVLAILPQGAPNPKG